MNTILSRLLPLLFSLLAAVSMAAQQRVCLSVHGGPATGVDNLGHPSKLVASIAGVTVTVFPAPGQGAAAVSAAHEAAFLAAGFTTMRMNANEFCIVAGPGGAPIVAGAAYGTTDPNLNLDNSVHPLLPPPAGNPGVKLNGGGLALPPAAQPPLPLGTVIQVAVKIRVGGVTVIVWVQIQIIPGLPGFLLQQQIKQQFEAMGYLGNLVQIEDPMTAGGTVDMLQLERTNVGEPIEGVEVMWDPISRMVMPTVTCAGMLPTFGAAEYGTPTIGQAFHEPWSVVYGNPVIGNAIDIDHETYYPNGLGVDILSLGTATLPVFGGWLLVDPLTMVLDIGLTDPFGAMHYPLPIPLDPALSGFELATQGVVLDSLGSTFSTGIDIVIR